MMQFTPKGKNWGWPRLVCDVCGEPIRSARETYVLRMAYALPEEPAYHVHGGCVDRFEHQHGGRWDRLPLQSREAAWFV